MWAATTNNSIAATIIIITTTITPIRMPIRRSIIRRGLV